MAERATGRTGRSVARAVGVAAAVGTALGIGLLTGGVAHATGSAAQAGVRAEAGNDAEDRITRYDLAIDLDDDGVAHVALDLAVDFGSSPNHGPYLTYVVKQRWDDTQDRVYRTTDVRASSSTGAAADVDVEEEGALLVLRIGDEDEEVRGLQEYRITYDVEGWVNASDLTGGDDELNLNVLGGWQVPVEDVTVTVTGPDDVTFAECMAGRLGSRDSCTGAESSGSTATFRQDETPANQHLTVVAGFPAGTFGGVEPLLQDRWSAGRAFSLTPATGLATLAALLGGAGLVGWRARLRGRDDAYLGLTPGLLPAPGQQASVGQRRRVPVTVQFTPPAGFRPGQLGTLVDEHADPRDVTATLVDLAVRGYLRIEQTTGTGDKADERDWRLVETGDSSDPALLPYEAALLKDVFAGRTSVELSALRTTFASSMASVQAALYEDVTERGWFRGNPTKVRARWAGLGSLVTFGAVVLAVLLAIFTTWALVGVGLVVVGVVMLSLTRAAPARTADGTAVLHQAEGFRQYLATAEGPQLRFEEGEDLFSRYLPYAIAFGVTERWARVFTDLAAQGHAVPDPTWYVGAWGYGAFWSGGGGFAESLTSFTADAESAITAPTPGSSGSSGSGGFSGGGVGGGGGGTW